MDEISETVELSKSVFVKAGDVSTNVLLFACFDGMAVNDTHRHARNRMVRFFTRYRFYSEGQNGSLNSSDRISNVTDCENIIYLKKLQAVNRSFLILLG